MIPLTASIQEVDIALNMLAEPAPGPGIPYYSFVEIHAATGLTFVSTTAANPAAFLLSNAVNVWAPVP